MFSEIFQNTFTPKTIVLKYHGVISANIINFKNGNEPNMPSNNI